MKKSNLIVAVLPVAVLFALVSSTRCFAETHTSDVKVEVKAVKAKDKVKVDLSSPDKTVQSFVVAIDAGNIDNLLACIYGIKVPEGKQGDEVRSRLTSRFGIVPPDASLARTSFTRVTNLKVDIQSSPVRVDCIVQIVAPRLNRSIRSSVFTKRDKDGWKILPTTQDELIKMSQEQMRANEGYRGNSSTFVITTDPVLSTVTEIALILPDITQSMERDKRAAEQEASNNADMTGVANLRQLALAAMQFVQEYDEKFEFDTSNFREKIKNYTRGEKAFLHPKTGQSFAMNSALANIDMSKIAAPSQTVLFYTGQNGQLSFDNFGKAAAAFADGHVKTFSREQATNLRWSP